MTGAPLLYHAGKYQERALSAKERKKWNYTPLHVLIQKMENGFLPIVIRDGYIWGYEMDMQELETAHENARSFPGLLPPDNARYIGYQRYGSGKYLYWKDSAGKYWYETERGMDFKREMEDAKKKKKKAPRRNWMPG